MVSNHRNTFERGIDQDTAKKYVAPNTYYSASNVTISKDGYIGEASTLNGFKELLDSNGNKVDLDVVQKDLHILNVTIGMSPGVLLFEYGLYGTQVLTVGYVSSNLELYNELKGNFEVYINDGFIYLYLDNVYNINNGIFVKTISADTEFKNLGVKEITLRDNNKLIFLFRKGKNNGFLNLQLIVYKDLENQDSSYILGTDFVFSGDIESDTINSDNIIYNKESDKRSSLYWCDGQNPDKVIHFTVSLDIGDYIDFQTYIQTIKNNILSQADNSLNERKLYFVPRPRLYNLILSKEHGKIKPAETILFFYKLKNNSETSNISPYSEAVNIPTDSLDKTDIARNKARYTYGKNRWSIQFSIKDIPKKFTYIEPYIVHYNSEGVYRVRKLPDISYFEETIVSYNEDFNESDLEDVELGSLFNFKSSEDISKEQIIHKNRLIKANLRHSLFLDTESYDTRAYRFKSITDAVTQDRRKAILYDRFGNISYTIDGSSPDYTQISKTADVINPYNDEYSDFDNWKDFQQFKYQADGETLGGSGENISYKILRYDSQETDKNIVSKTTQENYLSTFSLNRNDVTKLRQFSKTINPVYTPTGDNIHSGPITPYHETIKGFMGGEVYRFFLVLWESDQPTISKWISDVKFPENNKLVEREDSNTTSINLQSIEFTVNTKPFRNKATAVSIGYTKLSEENKTVLGTLPTIGFNYFVANGHFQQTIPSKVNLYPLEQNETVFMDYTNITSDYLSTVNTSGYTQDLQERYKNLSEKFTLFPIQLNEYGFQLNQNEVASGKLALKKIANLTSDSTIPKADLFNQNAKNYNPDGESLKPLNKSDDISPELRTIAFLGDLDNSIDINDYLGNSTSDELLVSPQPRLKNASPDPDDYGPNIPITNIVAFGSGTPIKVTITSIALYIYLTQYKDNDSILITPGSEPTDQLVPSLSGLYKLKNKSLDLGTFSLTFDLHNTDDTPVESDIGYISGNSYVSLVKSNQYFVGIDILSDNEGSKGDSSDYYEMPDHAFRSNKSFVILQEGFTSLEAGMNTLVSVRRQLKPTEQYGGNNFESRERNDLQIMSYSKVDPTEETLLIRPEGDTYVNYIDVVLDRSVRKIRATGVGTVPWDVIPLKNSHGIIFPIESKNNLYGVGSKNEDIVKSRWRDFPTYNGQAIMVYDGYFEETTPIAEVPNTVDIFRTDNTFKISSIAIQSRLSGVYPTKIKASERKFTNEAGDNWKVFLVNNSKILDPNKNQINKLVTLQDKLYVLQQDAIAEQLVDRVAQAIDDESKIILGTGDVLGEHIYIIDNIGITSNVNAVQTTDDIIFRDLIRKKLYSIQHGEIRGLSNLLKKDDLIGFNNNNYFRKILYDRETDMVFIPNLVNFETENTHCGYIGYDNKFKVITSDNSLKYSDDYFEGVSNLLNINSSLSVFNRNAFNSYTSDNVENNMEISFIVNPYSEYVKTFDNLFLNLEAVKEDSSELVDSFDYKPSYVKVETEYQTTNKVAITSSNMRRLGRYWRITLPRDTEGNRMRDYWAKVTLTFPYDSSKKRAINLKEVLTSFRLSNLTSH